MIYDVSISSTQDPSEGKLLKSQCILLDFVLTLSAGLARKNFQIQTILVSSSVQRDEI